MVGSLHVLKYYGAMKTANLSTLIPVYDMPELLQNQHYSGPSLDAANQCECSSVTYSMVGGCSACQGVEIVSWSSWSEDCITNFTGSFPKNIPVDTAVPGWAFDDLTDKTFDAGVALQETSLPESTATHDPSTETSSSVSSTSRGEQETFTVAPAANKSSRNVGAIAGGVVGGVIGLVLLCLLIALLLIKLLKNRRVGASNGKRSPVLQEKTKPQYQAVPYAPMPVSPPPGGIMNQLQKLYVCYPSHTTLTFPLFT